MKIISHNESETFELGNKFGKLIQKGMIISLNGDLGAGKTHFTKGIAKGLGIEEYVTSPSFTIVNEYYGQIPLYHFDVYRIEDIGEMYEIGFEEYLYGEGVCIVEWGDVVKDILPETTIHIEIKTINDDIREIEIDNFDALKELNP